MGCSLFSFTTENTLFGQTSSQNSKLFVYSEIWYLDYFEYVELNGDVHFLFFLAENTPA